MITYKKMTIDQCDNIKGIDASQYIGRAWREVKGSRTLVTIDYLDPDWPNGYEAHHDKLKQTIIKDGEAVGAFDEFNKLIGFVTVNHIKSFGKNRYALLDQLYISRESRGNGIGTRLFKEAIAIAKGFVEVENLLIFAGSAEETIAFYKAMGCTEASEEYKDIIDNDPRDIQMIYSI